MPDETKLEQGVERDDDYESLYANQIQFEPSLWDLKLIFGRLEQAGGARVVQHTAMSIPWAQAKLLAYFLEVNLAIHETDNGYIRLPPHVIPEAFDPATADQPLKTTWEYLAFIHRRFFPELYVNQQHKTQPPPEEPK